MKPSEISGKLTKALPFEPTPGQEQLIVRIGQFLTDKNQKTTFVLKGYAGTGKTSMVKAFTKIFPELGYNPVLMAPTGRAAKVLAAYSGKQAQTIHKRIYFQGFTPEGNIFIKLQDNLFKRAIFIVDEASMIPGEFTDQDNLVSQRNLLDDLIEYVYSGDSCRLIIIGDVAQLPPVGTILSPALNLEFLKSRYSLQIYSSELTEVMRQTYDSEVLINATRLRQKISHSDFDLPLFKSTRQRDLVYITGNELEELLTSAYFQQGHDDAVIITRSNKRANLFNQEIRRRILFKEFEVESGDRMMVVKNNYFWLDKECDAGFIANGDMIEILDVRKNEEMYGFHFADIRARMLDYPDDPPIEVKIILDTINAESASLSHQQSRNLYLSILEDYQDIPERVKRNEKVRIDPFYNALQVKFGYALTCHKTQGGQWDQVFVDRVFMKNNVPDTDFLRWMYTALTRSTSKVYLINYDEALIE